MAGVPTSRGCDACRKQKKKCDQSKPACSRCIRLRIACIGSGQRRFKFKEQSNGAQTAAREEGHRQPPSYSTTALVHLPSNAATTVASAFIAALEVRDLRYDLTCYGPFLTELPRRLGSDEALDAAVAAITAAYSKIYTGRRSLDMLTKYGHALTTLRKSLDNRAKAMSVNTLCAIYLVMVCQGWIGKQSERDPGHGEALSYILNVLVTQGWQGQFETNILVTSAVPVIVESAINPKVKVDSWLSRLSSVHGPDQPVGLSLRLKNLAQVASFVREPELHVLELRPAYKQAQADCLSLRHRLAEFNEQISNGLLQGLVPDMNAIKTRSVLQLTYGIVLVLAAVINALLAIFEPHDTLLPLEAREFCTEIIALAKIAAPYRPLGASWVPSCLVGAWATTNDPAMRKKIEGILAEYQPDFIDVNWIQIARWLQKRFEKVRLQCWTPPPESL